MHFLKKRSDFKTDIKAITKVFALILILLKFSAPLNCIACSMCKVTVNGYTYVGSNEDSWRRGSKIWFENSSPGKSGCVYVGFGDLPQGGMNEAGLAFDGLTTLPKPVRHNPEKKEISNPGNFLKEIMQTCKTVQDVKRFAGQYNRQKFYNNGVLLFADRTGQYLVIEADTLISGNDDKYIIANFCPSITSKKEMHAFDRYRRGEMFLSNHLNDTGANFCFALTDTMHECRKKIGDGTMYSFIADLNKGDFTLCFYHDFQHPVTFNLHQELAKGEHFLQMTDIFPENAEYGKFLNFKTPRNNTALLFFLFLSGGLFAFSSLFFLISFLGERKLLLQEKSGRGLNLLPAVISLILLYYLTVLYNHEEVYYFPAPYKDFKFSMLNIAAYIPWIFAALTLPLIRMNMNIFQSEYYSKFLKSLFAVNNLFYLIFIVLFFYWGFYNIFS